MNLLNKISIKSRFILTFAFLLALLLGFGLFSIYQMNQLGSLTATLYQHPLRVSNRSLRASMGVVKMHRGMKDITTSTTDLELNEAVQNVRREELLVYQHLDVVRRQILGSQGQQLERETRAFFADWKPIRDEVIELVMKRQNTAAIRITKGKGADHVNQLTDKMFALTSYARRKADMFMRDARTIQDQIFNRTLLFIGGVALLASLIAVFMARSILAGVARLKATMGDISRTGNLVPATLNGNNELTQMARHFNQLIERLQHQFWLRDGLNALNAECSGNLTFHELVETCMSFCAHYVDACAGGLYRFDRRSDRCCLEAGFALTERSALTTEFKLGEGIIGQAALEQQAILVRKIKPADAVIQSATIRQAPTCLYCLPLVYEKELYGVLEVAFLEELDPLKKEFLDTAGPIISTFMYVGLQNEQIGELLEGAQQANTQLEARSDELKAANRKLTILNKELQVKSRELEIQAEELKAQKAELETRRLQVEEADRLKSEFLSNMSHELRTPLNSVLALSQLMISKGTGLDPGQEKQYLQVIDRNGRQLLSLINDILDLSKIEAGHMDLHITGFEPDRTINRAAETIRPLAEEKGLQVTLDLENDLHMISDEDKLYQILLNLFSNAVKFTTTGEVAIHCRRDNKRIKISVRDTGIGISPQNITHIFDEFRQLDGSTTRSQGGTGLGLAISRKLAHLLGGEITVASQRGQGSTFTLQVPVQQHPTATDTRAVEANGGHNHKREAHEDAAGVTQCHPEKSQSTGLVKDTILVIDDDQDVRQLIKTRLLELGYHVIEAADGRDGINLARKCNPFAVTLDILMPECDGWEVLRELKASPDTAAIPVIIVSITADRTTGMALGAADYLTKPVTRQVLLRALADLAGRQPVKQLLVVDDDPVVTVRLTGMLTAAGYQTDTAPDGRAGLEKIKTAPPDVLILDLMMPGMNGFEVLERLRANPALRDMPVIVLTAKTLGAAEREYLQTDTRRLICKGALDEQQLLHGVETALADIRAAQYRFQADDRKLILVVEDNEIAALQICTAFEEAHYNVHTAAGGQAALDFIAQHTPDAVLLDLMMPGVDGFTVLNQIRANEQTRNIPVIVLTAKELTAEEKKQLHQDHIQQLIRKGDVDRRQLVALVDRLLRPDVATKLPEAASQCERGQDERILVVEDNPDNLLTITAILDTAGYPYLSTHTAYDALRLITRRPPALILMDVQLPGLSGLDATRRIRDNPATAAIPVIAVTAKAMQGARDEILAAGCDDYVAKPVEADVLLTKVQQWMHTH